MKLKDAVSSLKSLHPGSNFRLLILNNSHDMKFVDVFQKSDIREHQYETLGIGISYLFHIDVEFVVRCCLLLYQYSRVQV
jgi:hypothetical protein